jgi:hypothetical protein
VIVLGVPQPKVWRVSKLLVVAVLFSLMAADGVEQLEHFGCATDETTVLAAVDALVSLGMRDARQPGPR